RAGLQCQFADPSRRRWLWSIRSVVPGLGGAFSGYAAPRAQPTTHAACSGHMSRCDERDWLIGLWPAHLDFAQCRAEFVAHFSGLLITLFRVLGHRAIEDRL